MPTESEQTESTLDANSDATSQWVDDSFPPPHHSNRSYPSTSKYDQPSTSKNYESKNYDDNDMDRSLNSSESSFNALSVSQYDRRFDSGIDSERVEEARSNTSAINDLMTRMSSGTQCRREPCSPSGSSTSGALRSWCYTDLYAHNTGLKR